MDHLKSSDTAPCHRAVTRSSTLTDRHTSIQLNNSRDDLVGVTVLLPDCIADADKYSCKAASDICGTVAALTLDNSGQRETDGKCPWRHLAVIWPL